MTSRRDFISLAAMGPIAAVLPTFPASARSERLIQDVAGSAMLGDGMLAGPIRGVEALKFKLEVDMESARQAIQVLQRELSDRIPSLRDSRQEQTCPED